jgi:hypothetical protein
MHSEGEGLGVVDTPSVKQEIDSEVHLARVRKQDPYDEGSFFAYPFMPLPHHLKRTVQSAFCIPKQRSNKKVT